MDSSALVKLAVREPESDGLKGYIRRRRPLVSSALARVEVTRALLPLGPEAIQRAEQVLERVELHRINERVLRAAGSLLPAELRSLDAIHLATAAELGDALGTVVTYDDRLASAARDRGWKVVAPGA